MYIRKAKKYGKNIKIIHPGELYVSSEDELIGTLLGSCVSVCLYDAKREISGMNHFMLPGRISSTDIFEDKSARYGITAINELFSQMEKAGSSKRDLIGKIFGGGHVLDVENSIMSIPLDNIRLAKIMVEIEDVPIVEIEVGDNYTRKLLMDVRSGKVYLKKTTKRDIFERVVQDERNYIRSRYGK
ncbi:MAG: chemotaxis protein CheD [Spirochaetota bacterium]|nr:chemotaxis protein CheD [Spirochaetota bacterium]